MKGFKKDGKFIPTGNKSKSNLKKSDVKRKTVSRNKKSVSNDYHKVEQESRDTHQFFRTLKGLGQDWAYMRTEENEGTIAEGTIVLYDMEDNKIAEIPTVNFIDYIQDNLEGMK